MLRILRNCFNSYTSVSCGACSWGQGAAFAADHFKKIKKKIPLYRSEQRWEGCKTFLWKSCDCAPGPRASSRSLLDFLSLAVNLQEAQMVQITARGTQTWQECFLKISTQSSVHFVELQTMYFILISVPLSIWSRVRPSKWESNSFCNNLGLPVNTLTKSLPTAPI